MDETALLTHEIPPGAAWSLLLRRGRVLRLTALAAGANCSTLIYQAYDPVDRLNLPDTLKAQMSACVRPPMVLMSDRGVGLASVTGSSLDWHDALGGHSPGARFGLTSELAKHGRLPRDLHATVNFFSKIALADDAYGSLSFAAGHAASGDWVTLRAEVDLLLISSTAPHPLDTGGAPGAVRAEVFPGAEYGSDDPSWTFRDETRRSLEAAKAVFA